MAEPNLRIISDLHFGEVGSRIRRLDALHPVVDGAAHVVCNGDSIETRFLDLDPRARDRKAEFDAFLAAHDGRISLITGNHDPDICPRHFLELEEGRILITHGDAVFRDICPWGWEARYVWNEIERRLAATPEEIRRSWETHLRIRKEATIAVRDLSPRYHGHSSHPWRRRLRVFVSMHRLWHVFHAWRSTPEQCARMAEALRPAARVIIIGHTHFPGVWHRRGRIIINTGSAVMPLGGLAVDVCDRELVVRTLEFRAGEMRIGTVRHRLALDAIFAEAAGHRLAV